MNERLDNLCIVMVHTSHPGNIGSAARAMKTMGVKDLRLVLPNRFNSPETKALASGADDILDNARICGNLREALVDCHYVMATSARSERSLPWPQMNAREGGLHVAERLTLQKVALVFGRERTGLTNSELEHCHALVHIPMAFDFFSLNIAAAIQLLCYECRMAVLQTHPQIPPLGAEQELPATHEALEAFFEHLENTLIETRYLDPEHPRLLMRRMRRLFGRAAMTENEVSMLRGMLASFQGRKFRPRDA